MDNPYDGTVKHSFTFLTAESQIDVTETAWRALESTLESFKQACLVMPDQTPATWRVAANVIRTWPSSKVQEFLDYYKMMPRDNFHQLPQEFPAYIQVIKMLVLDWALENPKQGWNFLTFFSARNSSWDMHKAFEVVQEPQEPEESPELVDDAKFN